MFTQTQLKTMFEMQAQLNSVMGSPTWLTDDNNYLLAAKVELFEAIGHYGFKWWKKETPNLPQVHLEIVDAWHFIMSWMMVVQSKKAQQEEISETLIPYFSRDLAVAVSSNYMDIPVISTLEQLCDDLTHWDFSPVIFHVLCKTVDLSGADFFKMYVAKNALNLFRQKHGDKQGTYVKIWFGEEDNVFLAQQLNSLDVNADDFIEQLNASLEAQYAAVKAAVIH